MPWLLIVLIFMVGCATNNPPAPASSPPPLALKKLTPEQLAAEARYRAEVHTELAANYYTRRQFDIALEELKVSVGADRTFMPAYNLLGLIHMELGETKLAEQDFRTGLKLAPTNPDVNNNYGWFLCNTNREKDAIPFFLTAAQDPHYATPHKPLTNAGICNLRLGNTSQAEDYFRRALRLAPDDGQVNFNLADLNFGRGNLPQARMHLARVMESPNPTAEALWLAVRLERKMGDRNAEGSYGLKLKKRYPESREAKLLQSGKYE
ncbi:MAG: type IV pilus biogenesis/stability protein PilW [Burkholderiales bacterium]